MGAFNVNCIINPLFLQFNAYRAANLRGYVFSNIK